MFKATATANRFDVVCIRKSSPGQDEKPQIANVEKMLHALGVYVPRDNWITHTVSRRKLKTSDDFNRLMEWVEADRVGTVYVESQDRWGTGDEAELFALFGTLRDHGTRLFDLKAGKDLTEKDLTTKVIAFINSIKSQKELEDLAYRSLRSRVERFQATGSWPTGTHPYGYGKACYSEAGALKWVFQPINRKRGQVFTPDPSGALIPTGPPDAKIPRKEKRDVIKLVPSNNPGYVRAVRLIFELYTRCNLSRRQISARLNAEGLLFNGGPFTHPDVSNILRNPAYAGDTYFGKVQTGEIHTFDAKGLVIEVAGKRDGKHRPASECIVKRDTHEALVDRKTVELAQRKLAWESEQTGEDDHRSNLPPRNPAYYLKQLFRCGHCGKGLTGRTETDRTTRKRTVVYVCSTYVAGRCNGHPVPCGYQRITHEVAERLLLDKIKELSLPLEETIGKGARENIRARLARLGHEDEESSAQFTGWLSEGIDALADYLIEQFPEAADWPNIQRLRRLALNGYLDETAARPGSDVLIRNPRLTVDDLKRTVREVEEGEANAARGKIAELRAEHTQLTRAWAKATDAMQAVLKGDIERIEGEMRDWEPRTVPLTDRLDALVAAERERQAEREKLLAEWPALEGRERGEAMRRLFDTVTLFWDKTWEPASPKPTRPRKTDRPGRFRYTLKRDEIKWSFAACDPVGSW
jgi:hypothetical protein